MDVLENVERLSSTHDYEAVSGLTDSYRDYIKEVLPTQDQELIVARIDELSAAQPPQAIDSNPEVAALLAEQGRFPWPSRFLPSDIRQS